MGDAFVIGN